MNIVEQVARVIDPEAFAEPINKIPWPLTGLTISGTENGRELETARRALHQSTAICRAVEVLRIIGGHQDALVEYEIEGWKRLGIPVATLESPEAIDTIRRKYA